MSRITGTDSRRQEPTTQQHTQCHTDGQTPLLCVCFLLLPQVNPFPAIMNMAAHQSVVASHTHTHTHTHTSFGSYTAMSTIATRMHVKKGTKSIAS